MICPDCSREFPGFYVSCWSREICRTCNGTNIAPQKYVDVTIPVADDGCYWLSRWRYTWNEQDKAWVYSEPCEGMHTMLCSVMASMRNAPETYSFSPAGKILVARCRALDLWEGEIPFWCEEVSGWKITPEGYAYAPELLQACYARVPYAGGRLNNLVQYLAARGRFTP